MRAKISRETSEVRKEKIITLLKIAPRTITELRQRTGMSDTHIRRIITHLRDAGESHISSYKKIVAPRTNALTALHKFGPGKDAKPPSLVIKQREALKQFNADNPRAKKVEREFTPRSFNGKVECYGGLWGLS